MITLLQLAFAILFIERLPNGFPTAPLRTHELGAEVRAIQLATDLLDASLAYHVDTAGLTALASRESHFDSHCVGRAGEMGIMQLHPRWPAGRAFKRYAHTEGVTAAQADRYNIFLGAQELSHGMRACGKLSSAFVFYRTGHCGKGPRARSLMIVRREIIRASGASRVL